MDDLKPTISDITEEIVSEICEKYCRFPFEIDDQEELDAKCRECILNRLV